MSSELPQQCTNITTDLTSLILDTVISWNISWRHSQVDEIGPTLNIRLVSSLGFWRYVASAKAALLTAATRIFLSWLKIGTVSDLADILRV